MTRMVLNNKPLVEAIFELKWQLQEIKPGIKTDPFYKLIVGRLYDKLQEEYPFYEPLEAASIPDEMIAGAVQHRYRKAKNEWPLIQIGPGVFSVNDINNYVWDDFKQRVIKGVNVLYNLYPSTDKLKISNVMLRYIDAIEFDYEKNHVFEFIKDKMKTEIMLLPSLFEGTNVNSKPEGFDLRFSFPCEKPKGIMNLRIGRGKRNQVDSLIWETVFVSLNENAPKDPNEIQEWLESSHALTDDWFFKLIDGELLRRFM